MLYHGKHEKKIKNTGLKKSAMLLAALMLIFTVSVGATLAYIIDTDEPITNVFKPSQVACEVVEAFDGSTKSSVKIQNIGNTDSYIRAAIVVTWKDTSGNVYGKAPVLNDDYSLEISGTGWTKGADNYYYHNNYVTPDERTSVLITESKQLKDCENKDYTLSVEILAEAIQSKPADAVDSWDNAKVNLTGNADGTALTVTNN